jgi:hypothetical protein
MHAVRYSTGRWKKSAGFRRDVATLILALCLGGAGYPAAAEAATRGSAVPAALSTPGASAGALAELPQDRFEASIRDVFRKPETTDNMVATLQLDPAASAVFRRHLRALYGDDRLIRQIAAELYAARESITPENAHEMGRQIGQAVTARLEYAGMGRLPDADIKLFFETLARLPSLASPEQCKAVFSDDNADKTIEFKLIARLGADVLENYLAILRKAMFAEMADSPSMITLTKTQSDLSEGAFGQAVGKNLAALAEADRQRVTLAISDIKSATDADACDAHHVMFYSVATMGGLPGDWFRRTFIAEMSH